MPLLKPKSRFAKAISVAAAVGLADAVGLVPAQTSADLRALVKGTTNTLVAVPTLAWCVYDYSRSLKGLTYPSEEYKEARSKCHERSAAKVLWLSQHCGGIYLKAGQYFGSLDRMVPKEYTQELKKLQDKVE